MIWMKYIFTQKRTSKGWKHSVNVILRLKSHQFQPQPVDRPFSLSSMSAVAQARLFCFCKPTRARARCASSGKQKWFSFWQQQKKAPIFCSNAKSLTCDLASKLIYMTRCFCWCWSNSHVFSITKLLCLWKVLSKIMQEKDTPGTAAKLFCTK